MNYEQLLEHEKELYEAFLLAINHLYDNPGDEFFNEEVNEFKKHLKVYRDDE